MTEIRSSETAPGDLASSAYLEAALDCVIVADAAGRVVEFNPAAERTFGYSRAQALGRTLAELIVPPSLRGRHTDAFGRFVESGEGRLFGQRLELTGMRADGSEFPVELALSLVQDDPLRVCGALRDLSDAKQADEELRKHAAEHAALRRVATLVAQGASPADVFAAVAEGVADLLGVPAISMVRFDADGTATKVAGWGESPFPVGSQWTLDEPSVMAAVAETGRTSRIDDYATVSGRQAELICESGIRAAAGVPITVDGTCWGVVIAFSPDPQQLSAEAEDRLARFTELVATAIANTQARQDLHQLADEQTALRRVATLIAREARPAEVFAAVATEVAKTLDVPLTAVVRYETDGTATQVGAWGEENPFPVGTSWTLDEHSVSGMVAHTGRPARVDDYAEVSGDIAATLARAAGIRTAVGVPVLVDGAPWGVMMALSTEKRPLPPGTEDRLAAFTELIATAISNVQARDERHVLADEQAALRRVAVLVAREASTAEVFAVVAEEVARVLDVRLVQMSRYASADTVTVIGTWGEQPFPPGSSWPLDGPTLSARVLQTKRPARIDSYDDVPGTIGDMIRAAGIRSGVGVPIVVDGKLWGVMMVLSTARQRLPDGTETRLAAFTELVATAIANAQARDELRLVADEQAALRRVATLVAGGSPPEDVFWAVIEEVRDVLGADGASLLRYHDDYTRTELADTDFELVGERTALGGHNAATLVFETGRPVRIEDYARDATGPSAAHALHSGWRSCVAVPLNVDGRLWGVVMAASKTEIPLPPDAEQRLAKFTELVATAIANTQARADLRRLLEEQAALRRVATLVATGAESRGVFDAVCEETGRLIGAASVNLARFTSDGFNLTMAGWSLRDTHVPTDTRLPLEGETINALVRRTGAPARVDSYDGVAGELAQLIRGRGIKSEVGAPVVVEGEVWGALIAGWDGAQLSPEGTELRLAKFAELIATAVSNASNRSELIASRARIVAGADEARRRIERNLHDGVQQQLVSLELEAKTLEAGIPRELQQTHRDIKRLQGALENVLDDVREISQGVHPATLSQWGLGPLFERSHAGRRFPSSSRSTFPAGWRNRPRSRLTTSSPRRLPTWPSMPRRRTRVSRSPWMAAGSGPRFATTESAAPIARVALASQVCWTVSRRSADGCRW